MSRPRARGDRTRRVRLVSGLVLMTYATTHLINHAFGLISYEAAEAARRTPLGFWHYGLIGLVLLAALLAHITTALMGIYERRTLHMPLWQGVQMVFGLAIPFLLVVHILATAGLENAHGMQVNYYLEFWLLWPGLAEQQILLSLLVWLHGCIGLHFWLRQHASYRGVQAGALVLAVLLPTFSMLGFVAGGREMHAAIAADPGLLARLADEFDWVPLSETVWVFPVERGILWVFTLLVIAVLVARTLRHYLALRRDSVRLTYDGGRSVRVPIGTSVLEASRIAGIPHASVCGGRGRCSTCRVRVAGAAHALPAASPEERRVLDRLGATAEVRLACQLRPTEHVEITRLMPAGTNVRDALRRMDPGQGSEREIAVLFADLRGFTRFSEGRLPFDVVFVLNRYFTVMGEAIEAEGGHLDKFIGDGIMALFGVEGTPRQAATDALAGARRMGKALEALNAELAGDLPSPLRMGIGVHLGTAIIGEMGYGRVVSLTAIGDTVNVASRLESASKELAVEAVVSAHLIHAAGLPIPEEGLRELAIRGRAAPLEVLALPRAADLPLPESPDHHETGSSTVSLARLFSHLRRPAADKG